MCACAGGHDSSDARGGAPFIPEASGGASVDVPAPGTFELDLLSDDFVQLGFEDGVTLRVRLLDRDGEPIEGGHIGFALVGRSQDSSLAGVDAVTGADGIAENELMSGEMAAAFRVRITALGAYETFVEVGVSNSGFGTLQVQADYAGSRTVLQRQIFAQAGMDCERAEGMPGDPMVTLGPGEDTAQFVALPAGVSYAISAFAESQEGTVVASGCIDAVMVRRDDLITASVTFSDEPLLPSGRFALQADLDAAAPAISLGSTLRDGTETLVNTDALGELVLERAEARFLLDSLDATLRSDDYEDAPGALELADALAQERATPSGPQPPEQSLQTLLSIKDEGALTAVSRIVQLTIADIERLRLLVDLTVVDDDGELSVSWQVERLEALSTRSDAPVLIDSVGVGGSTDCRELAPRARCARARRRALRAAVRRARGAGTGRGGELRAGRRRRRTARAGRLHVARRVARLAELSAGRRVRRRVRAGDLRTCAGAARRCRPERVDRARRRAPDAAALGRARAARRRRRLDCRANEQRDADRRVGAGGGQRLGRCGVRRRDGQHAATRAADRVSQGARYRWQSAETLKQAQRAAAERALALAERALARAVDEAAEAQRALAEHGARAPASTALDAGVERALELQRAVAYTRRHAERERALRAQLSQAQAQVVLQQAAVAASQASLAAAHTGEQTIERDRERFEREQRKRAEQGEQHELDEQRLGNPGGRKRL